MLQLISNNKFRPYDSLQPDAYLTRLAAASRVCGVRAYEDIYSAQNVLLIKQDALITPEIVSAIYHCKLKKPIEALVHIDHQLHVEQLEKDFLHIMQNDDFLMALNEHQDLVSLIHTYIYSYDQFPVLKQKLSVMAISMREFYQRTIYCTWFSILIAKEMHFSETDITHIFLAALSHDIGMLHLDSAVLDRKSQLSPEDWRHIQSHIFIGKKILEAIPDMPPAVVNAVFEHHERCDGTGYPAGKVESELTHEGKIVGLADSIIAIYHNRFNAQNRNWRDVIPAIQMNAQEYFFRHDEVLAIIWLRSEMPLKNVVQDDALPQFVADLLEKHDKLKYWFEILREALLSVGFTHGDRSLHSLQNVIIRLATSTRGSGVFSEESVAWLRDYNSNQVNDTHHNITQTHVLQEEIIFHLQRLSRMMQLYVESDLYKKPAIQTTLKDALEKARLFMIDSTGF